MEQTRQVSKQVADAERIKRNATQEAGYYCAKLTVIKNTNGPEIARSERNHVAELERSTSDLMNECWA